MDISLNGYENFIKEQMSTGLYNSVNDIVNEAMSLLKLKKSISKERIDALNADIQMGIDDIKAGRTIDGETAFKKLMSKYE
jgi:putative addiction module CopG family antidote